MAEDKLYEEANEDLGDTLLDYGTNIAAAGVAAASFYRAGGVRALSKKLADYSHSQLKRAVDDFRGLNYDHINYRTLKESYRKIRDGVKDFKAMPHDNRIRWEARPGTPIELIMDAVKLRESTATIAEDARWQREVVRRIQKTAYKNLSSALSAGGVKNRDSIKLAQAQMEKFVKHVASEARKGRTDFDANALQKRYKVEHAGSDFYQKVIDTAKSQAERFSLNKTKRKGASIEEQLADRLESIETLERAAGGRYIPGSTWRDKLLGDRLVTIKDVLEHADKFNDTDGTLIIGGDHSVKEKSFLRRVQELHEKYKEKNDKEMLERFENLVVDPHLRKGANGEIFSLDPLYKARHKLMKDVAYTMPGKILKVSDLMMSESTPAFYHFKKGTLNPVLAALEGHEGKRIMSDYFYMAGRVYRYDEEHNKLLEDFVKELDDGTFFSTRFAGLANLYKDINGLNAQRVRKDGSIAKILDLNAATGMNPWEYIASFFSEGKDNKYLPNVIKNIRTGRLDAIGDDLDDAYERVSDLNIFLNKSTRGLTLSMLNSLEGVARAGAGKDGRDALEIISLLKLNDGEQILDGVKGMVGAHGGTDSAFLNNRLNRLINKFARDEGATRGSVELLEDISGAWNDDGVSAAGGLDFYGQLQRELSKEALMRLAENSREASGGLYNAIKGIIENSGMSHAEEEAAKRLAYTSFLDNETQNVFTGFGKYQRSTFDQIDGQTGRTLLEGFLSKYVAVAGGQTTREGERDAARVIQDMVNDGHEWQMLHGGGRGEIDFLPEQYIESDYAIIRKSSGPLDILKSLNESIKAGSLNPFKEEGMNFINQLKAGGTDASNVSIMTMIPYFFLRRLGADDLPPFLQFSNEALNSTWDLTKGIAKRIAPVVIGETYLEWGDDTVGAVTGIRPSAGLVNGLDYMDIGARKMLDMTGIGGMLDSQSYVNPVMQYWGGRDGYYDADEERDYIANGYEAVRRGRFWAFGSVNEFRGSTIEYYQPTLTRRLNSDYYNKSLYDGYWDKWGHSLLPTPTAPLSPLVYLMDPYYLEEEHKEDRPYTVSGTMFDKETPWGIVLNPTIGELVKPVVKMNQDRLTDDGQDVKAIIYGINQHIRDTAQGDHAYAMVFDREQITAGEYTSYASPSLGQYNIRIGKERGEQMRQKQLDTLGGPMEPERRSTLYEPGGSGDGSGEIGFGFGGSGGGGGGSFGGQYPLDLLGQTNRKIFIAAARNENRGGMITTDYIHYSKLDDILGSEDMNDLMSAGAGGDLVHEMSQSLRLIGGIYGYGANRAFGFGERDGKQIADAGDMDSFSRSFWDESLGGIGGGTAEIARRFIPEYRRNIRVNPLLNTMPDWLPEKLRFGDPYAQLPKGEARLPGKGYEALNELHPDQYGVYGAYDRYKILADVAPNSTEFKVWKKIANATVEDPALKKDMEKIQDRVNEQNKQHDFYDYRILGKNVDYQDAIIQEINKDGTFRIRGSNRLLTLAGIEFDKEQTRGGLGNDIMLEYMHPGQSVTIATDSSEYNRDNPDGTNNGEGTVNAAVFVDGESVSALMLGDHKDVIKRKDEHLNAADVYALTGTFDRFVGGITEAIAHADLPLIHDRWLRVRSPLESYKAEQIYGTPYQTWSDVWGTYVQPAMERAVSDHWDVIRGTAEWFALNNLREREGLGKTKKMLLSGAAALMNRGAFIGSSIATFLRPGDGELFQKGGKIGLGLSLLGNMYTSAQSSPLEAAASYATAGWMAADVLDEEKEKFTKELSGSIKKFFRNEESWKFRTKGAFIGAAAGFAVSGLFGPSLEDGDRAHWTPDRIKKKWELEDYFDRLTYIKYTGLYNRAAELAKSEEGIDVKKIFDDYEEWSDWRREIMEDSDVNNTEFTHLAKKRIQRALNGLHDEIFGGDDKNNHRFEYDNGFSINDLPGVRNGIFHSEEISEEERLYTLNALVTLGIRYNKPGSTRTQDDRDMTQLTAFEHVYGEKIPDYYQVHHIVEFSENGADDPSNMIALNPDDHQYITEQQKKIAEGDFVAAEIGARTAMRIGEYGRAALLYKKAAEATMYGLRADARWTDVVKALPKYERDYFTEFMREKDPDKREEILESASPFLRRALKQVWKMDYEADKGPDNEEYFESHNLPNFQWEGWDPDSDLNKVKAKTIKNEGMLFSDFGIYESTYRDQEVINAPNLSPKGGDDPITVQANLQATLSGLGLIGVEVSVEPKSTKGITSVINVTKVASYKLGETVDNLFS